MTSTQDYKDQDLQLIPLWMRNRVGTLANHATPCGNGDQPHCSRSVNKEGNALS